MSEMKMKKQKRKLEARKTVILKKLTKFQYRGMNAEAAIEVARNDEKIEGIKEINKRVSLVEYFKAKHLHMQLEEISGALKEGVLDGKEEKGPADTNVEQR